MTDGIDLKCTVDTEFITGYTAHELYHMLQRLLLK